MFRGNKSRKKLSFGCSKGTNGNLSKLFIGKFNGALNEVQTILIWMNYIDIHVG